MICALMIGFAFLFTGEAQQGANSQPSTSPIPMSGSVDVLSKAALWGDATAAWQLMEYYMYEKNMDPKYKYWTLIGAENGDPGAQFNEYNILSGSDDPMDWRRAYYWLRKAVENRAPYSKIEMDRCFPFGHFESMKKECFGSRRP
ncbi:SEL1-like repeat protein [Rhodanobacter hydrolyticus]|uniref:Sel1 repeat family protein n=1 Tax=Rhodanobacter hydrolyticus TaxID=2250595 RepID=A0ABW8J956_9GAMM